MPRGSVSAVVAVSAVMTVGAAAAASALIGAPQANSSSEPQLVLLDVVATGRDHLPVVDLRAEELTIKEDGRPVEIKTFTSMNTTGSSSATDGRSMVILLDDSGVPASGTVSMRDIARAFLSLARAGDEVSVVRLHGYQDEPYGDMRVALSRVQEYQAGSVPFADWETPEYTLKLLADLSRQLHSIDSRRKVIVCIGSPAVCNIAEPPKVAPRRLYVNWVDALRASADANVGIYAFIPAAVRLRGGGIVDMTGGEVLASTSDYMPAVQQIWQAASHYDLIGYWPTTAAKDLHSITVNVARRGVQVRARRVRAH